MAIKLNAWQRATARLMGLDTQDPDDARTVANRIRTRYSVPLDHIFDFMKVWHVAITMAEDRVMVRARKSVQG